jgi:hypothetical protein
MAEKSKIILKKPEKAPNFCMGAYGLRKLLLSIKKLKFKR